MVTTRKQPENQPTVTAYPAPVANYQRPQAAPRRPPKTNNVHHTNGDMNEEISPWHVTGQKQAKPVGRITLTTEL